MKVTNTLDSLTRSFLTGYDVQLAIQSRLQNNDPQDETSRTARDMWSKDDDEDVTLEIWRHNIKNRKRDTIDLLKDYNIKLINSKQKSIIDITEELIKTQLKDAFINNKTSEYAKILELFESISANAQEEFKNYLDIIKSPIILNNSKTKKPNNNVFNKNKEKIENNDSEIIDVKTWEVIRRDLKNYLSEDFNKILEPSVEKIKLEINDFEDFIKKWQNGSFIDNKACNSIKDRLLNITKYTINYLRNGLEILKELGINI